jgi:hypothetical protein
MQKTSAGQAGGSGLSIIQEHEEMKTSLFKEAKNIPRPGEERFQGS